MPTVAEIVAAVKATFIANAGVSGVIGSRLFSERLPQNAPTFPAAIYDVDVEPVHTHDGARSGNFLEATVGFTLYGRTDAAEVQDLADKVAAAIVDLDGTIDGQAYSGAKLAEIASVEWDDSTRTWMLDLEFEVTVS